MLKYTFLIVFSLLVCTRKVFSQWDFAVTTRGKILFFDENWADVTSAAHQFDDLSAITFDEVEERIFFNDRRHNNGSIFSLKLPIVKGSPHVIENILTRTPNERVSGIAYDPLNRNLFWTDSGNRKIFFFPIDASGDFEPKVLFDFANEDTIPDGIAIDICRRKLYWTSSNQQNPSIQRASLSGEDRETLINTDLYFPHGITVDQLTDRIFYVVDQPGVHFTVESAKLDGTDRQIIVEGVNSLPFSLAVTKDSVYWTDLTHKAVWKVSKVNSTENRPVKVKHSFGDVRGIVSRLGMLSKLKSDKSCQGVIKKVERGLFPINNTTDTTKKTEERHEMICLGNGLYSNVSKACACKAGYSGARCETYECHNFCVHGTCSIVDGFPQCMCQLGFKGERCQTSKCSNYCLNDGRCKIEDNEPVCDCHVDMLGSRCESNVTEACAPFCTLLAKNMDVDLPYHCYGVCKHLHPTNEVIQRAQRPDELCRNSWNKSIIVLTLGVLGGLVLIYLIISAIRRIYKPVRPRIRKTFVLQKKISQTPLTSRPIATEQCEITIENCCNMNICDTPCFDPKLLQQNMVNESRHDSRKEDKEILINNMENEIY